MGAESVGKNRIAKRGEDEVFSGGSVLRDTRWLTLGAAGDVGAEPRNADRRARQIDGPCRGHRTRGHEGRHEQGETQAPVHAWQYDMPPGPVAGRGV